MLNKVKVNEPDSNPAKKFQDPDPAGGGSAALHLGESAGRDESQAARGADPGDGEVQLRLQLVHDVALAVKLLHHLPQLQLIQRVECGGVEEMEVRLAHAQ